MLEIRIEAKGTTGIQRRLERVALRAKDRQSLHAIAGHKYLFEELPRTFRAHGPGWPAPKRRIGSPLQDTGRLQASWAYQASSSEVRIGTKVRYAVTHQEGRVIRPRNGKFLLIPLSPPLTSTEARAWPIGKAAIASRYPGSFFLMKGPEGPGIYRKTKRIAYGIRSRSKHMAIERIAAAVRFVKIEKREIIHPAPSGSYVTSLGSACRQWIVENKGRIPAVTAGTPDVGPRKGQLA